MKLVAVDTIPVGDNMKLGKYTFKKDFERGWQMSDFMLKLDRDVSKINSDGIIYWHSNHHQILLWFEKDQEKYLTFLLL